MTGVCRIKDLHMHTKITNIHAYIYTCIHLHAYTCMHTYTISHNYKALHNDIVYNIYMNLEEHRLKHIICSIVLRYFEQFVLTY